jgi:hypothetical protein
MSMLFYIMLLRRQLPFLYQLFLLYVLKTESHLEADQYGGTVESRNCPFVTRYFNKNAAVSLSHFFLFMTGNKG